jgi:hypothetical protein
MTPILGIMASQISGHLETGAFESIATVNGTGSAGNLVFTSIPGTFKSLQIRLISKDITTTPTSRRSKFLFNGSTTNYAYHYLRGNGTSPDANSGTSYTEIYIADSSFGSDAPSANMVGVSVIDIIDYASATKYKTVKYMSGIDRNLGTTDDRVAIGSALWMDTSPITSITMVPPVAGFSTLSQFALYGVK